MAATIYVDESGNDGPNYLNPETPFYVLAGWVVPNKNIVDATVLMEGLRISHVQGNPDLKFRMLKRKPWVITQCVTELGRIGLVPMYVLAEKKFCVAGKIVETFMDPRFNPRLGMRFTGLVELKQELANTIYERLSYDTLTIFAQAYRAPTREKLVAALEAVANEVSTQINVELSELLNGSHPNLSAIIDDELKQVELWGKAMGTLNAPCFISFLMMADRLGESGLLQPRRLVHDEQGPYQDDYISMYNHHKDLQPGDYSWYQSMGIHYGAIKNIEEFEIQRSVDQPLIQAADLLAGSIGYLASSMIDGRTLTPQEIELAGLVFPAMLSPHARLANPVCSGRMLSCIGKAMSDAYPVAMADSETKNRPVSLLSKSNLRDEGPLDVLPFVGSSVRPASDALKPKVRIDLPIYALVNSAGEPALLLSPEAPESVVDRTQRCLPLWLNHQLAVEFLDANDWTEPHSVKAFGPESACELIQKLRDLSVWTDRVVFDLQVSAGLIPIEQLANDFERIYQRISTAKEAGIINALYQQCDIDGLLVGSLLLSSGEYAAMVLEDGRRVTARTRVEALEKLTLELRANSPNAS